MALLSNTPIWVWAILIFLVAVGVRQLKPREVRWFQPLIAPAIFAPLLVIGVLKSPVPLIGFIALALGIMLGVGLGALRFQRAPLLIVSNKAGNATNHWYQRGSAIPLVTYLYIFITRFIASALPHFPIPALPDYVPNIVVGFTGIGMGLLLAIALFRQNNVD